MKPEIATTRPAWMPVMRLPAANNMIQGGLLPALAVLAALLLAAEPAAAADNLFGTESPLLKFVDFITGPFAYGIVIVALVVTVGVLMYGGEFSGFARRMPIVVVAGAIVILAGEVITNLFGATRAANWPPAQEPMPSQPHCTQPAAAPSGTDSPLTALDALPDCMPSAPGGPVPVDLLLAALAIGVVIVWCFGALRTRTRTARIASAEQPGDQSEGFA